MNDAIKEVRAALEQARTLMARHDDYNTSHFMRPGLTAATAIKLTEALDILTGEVERLDTATKGLLDLTKNLHERIKILTSS